MANGNGKWPLPEGWEWKAIGALGVVVTGTTPSKKSPSYYGGEIPFVKPGDLDVYEPVVAAVEYLSEVGARKSRVIPRNSVMVTCIGSIGKSGISGRDVTTNQQINTVIPDTSIINPRYLLSFTKSNFFLDDLNESSSATTVAIINKSNFSKITIPVAPRQDQDQIVAEIEKQFTRLDAAVAALKRAKANLARYKAAVLKAAVEGRLAPQDPGDEPAAVLLARILAERRAQWEAANPKKRYVEPKRPEVEGLPELPVGWVWATVEELAAHEPQSITDGPFGSKLKTEHYTETGPRVIRLQNIGDGEFVNAMAHISEVHYESLRRHSVFAGDLVIAGLGTSLPRACIIPDHVGPAIVKADCIRFKPHPSLADPHYLNTALNSEPLKQYATMIIHGVGRPRLNQEEIRSLVVPLPPVGEQRRVAEDVERRISVIQASLQVIDANLARAERLRQGVLGKAFRGELVK